MMRSSVRRVVSVGACVGLLVAGGHLTLQANAAATAGAPSEVSVVAADPAANYTSDRIYFAGATGFLHQYGTTTSPILWTRYADGATTAIPDLAGVSPALLTPAGGDVVTTTATVPGHSVSSDVTVLDLATMAWRELPRPTAGDGAFVGYYGDAMVIRSGTAKLDLRRFAADGTYTTTPVTGIPADATSVVSDRAGDATGVVLHLAIGGEVHYALLDLTTAVVTVLPVQPTTVREVLLNADRVGFLGGPADETVVRSYPRTSLTDDPQVVSLPDLEPSYTVALAGTHVVAAVSDGSPTPLVDYSAAGQTVVPLVQPGQVLAQGTDGVLLVGGTGPADWAVRRMTADGKVAALLPLDGPLTNAGLSISQGLLRHVEAEKLPGDPATHYLLFNHTLTAGTDGTDVTPPRTNGGTLVGALPCDAAVTCTRTLDGDSYGTAFLTAGTTATTSVLKNQADANTSTLSTTIPSAPGRIVDASSSYVVVNGTDPAKQYVIKTGYSDAPVAGPIGAAALWFDTLWTSPKTGELTAKNLETGKTATPVKTGAPCVATELQATGRYVYWSCGANGPAGVYDQTRKVSTAVPAGQSLLGDGYVVRHDSGSGDLIRRDLATGTDATVGTIARGTLADDRGITWAVDRFGGDIAYVDAADALHVVDPGITPTAPAVGIRGTSTDDRVSFGEYGAWSVYYDLSRPVATWTLKITQVSTGQVVATRTGGPNRVQLSTGWDGYLTNKKKASSGHYTYTTTATATAGATPVTIDSGTLVVDGGIPNLHSYESTGQPSILGIRSNGDGHWLDTTTGTALHDNGSTEDWPWGSKSFQVNALVPFGDFNNDGMNDLIARSGTGVLRAYLGFGQAYFGGVKTVTIGSGWNQYNAILTSGDLTGDGITDLLARDKNGKLWRYDGTGKKSFAGRVAVPGSYKSYSRVIGPGDINGDGKADLLLVSSAGELYSAYGTGKGTFGAVHKVSSGWNKYNVVISAGDLNEDSHPDLLARDSAGVLWRYLGTGKGGFAARQKVGTGYQKYSHLF